MRAWVAALLFITACGAVHGQGALPLPSPPTQALVAWKNFPARANPRPIIVFDRTLERFGPGGFSSEPNRKIDWFCNKFVLADGVDLSRTAPGHATAGSASYQSIGSERAYSELMAARPAGTQAPNCATSKPFVIKGVRWGTAGFPTDRGTMTMSAWLFDIDEIDAYLAYAALDPAAFWGRGVTTNQGRGARVSADGLTLRIPVSNAGPGPCGSDYTAAAAESAHAVAVAVKQIPHTSDGQGIVCPAVLRLSYINADLKSPLDGRVLLDEKGNVGAVCPETGQC